MRPSRLGKALGLVGAAGLLAACGSSPSIPVPPAAQSSAPGVPHLVSTRASGERAATLDVTSGATAVTVRVGRVAGALLTAATPDGSADVPTVRTSAGGVVDVGLVSAGSSGGRAAGPASLTVVVNPTVVWTVELDGGATTETVDLRGGRVSLVDLAAGVSRATVRLPAGRGTQRVREAGGVSDLTVSAPSAARSRVEADGGVSSLRIGRRTHPGVGARHTFTDPGYAAAADCVDVVLQGGVSSAVVSG